MADGSSLDGEVLFEIYAIANNGRSGRIKDSSGRRHVGKSKVVQDEWRSATG